MAYLAQTATDLNDILVKAASFFTTTGGWTQNSLADDSSYYEGSAFTGKRLHLQKTFSTEAGNVTVYANLRSANNQRVIEQDYDVDNIITGIACNASRGYSGAASWDKQTTYPTYNSDSCAAMAHLRITSSIDCHFFSGTHCGAIVMEGADQWFVVCFGVTDLGVPFFAGSGGIRCAESVDTYRWSRNFMHSAFDTSVGVDYPTYHYGFYEDSAWKLAMRSFTVSGLRSTTSLFGCNSYDWSDPSPSSTDSLASVMMMQTPNQYNGNPIFCPSYAFTGGGPSTAYPIKLLGVVPDLFMVNMTNIADAEEITIGSETFKCFTIDGDQSAVHSGPDGFALRK